VRGYEEPSAPERSRVFGFTLKGNPIHEFAFKVKEICANKTISSREELADELDRQGYKVKRKSTGRPCGRKSLTLVAKDGQQITLVGSPIEPIKAPKLVSKEEYLEQTVEAELRELNRLCRARAQRNWNIYRKKRTQQTEEQARETGYGFSPITLNELIPINETERKQRRTGLFAGKKLKGNTGVEQATTGTLGSTAPSHSEAGAEKREFGQFPSESVSGFDENQRINRRPASDFRSIGLKESIGQASGAIKERIKKFVKKAKQDIKDLGGPPTQSH
jgi:hypothetical protein